MSRLINAIGYWFTGGKGFQHIFPEKTGTVAHLDDIKSYLEYATKSAFPVTGVANMSYLDKATGRLYRWDTTVLNYFLIGGSDTPYMSFAGTNTYTATNSPALTSYPKALYGVFTNANTGSSTVAIDSLSALPVKMNGQSLVAGNIPAGSVKLLLLSSDSSRYEIISSVWEIPKPMSGEKALSIDSSSGLSTDNSIIDAYGATATTGAQLESQTWTGSDPVTYTGVAGEVRFWNNYKYECSGTNIWWRTPYNLIVSDIIIGSVNDSGGVKTSAQMTTLYPNAIPPQIVWGTAGKYQYVSSLYGWMYFENKI